MKICGYEPHTLTMRQVEFSLAGPYSSCQRSMLFRSKYHTLFGLNSTIKGLTEFVKPLKIEFSLKCGI